MKSVMTDRYSHVPDVNIYRTKFDRSHGHKTVIKPDYLYPIMVDEVYPGDTHSYNHNIFVRQLSPMQYPVLDNMYIDTFSFFVPWRLVWDDWVHFMGEKIDPDDETEYNVPYLVDETITEFELWDYFGIPTGIDPGPHQVSALWGRAYYQIWNDWFRDNDLQLHEIIDKTSTNEAEYDYVLLKRNKRRDYFTSCRPWPQAGDEVLLPLGDTAPVVGTGMALGLEDDINHISSTKFAMFEHEDGRLSTDSTLYGDPMGTVSAATGSATNGVAIGVVQDGDYSGIVADLQNAISPEINLIREALLLQQLLELIARGGTRYIEQIYHQFKVTCPDFRLQRPEYLGGSSDRIGIQPVTSTTDQNASSKFIGTMAGNASAFAQGGSWTKSFTEHGCIMVLANIRADITYQRGINRMFSRSSRFDFYTPMLQGLGEQAVLNQEIYAVGSANLAQDAAVFGYQRNFEEMCYKESQVTGLMRSDSTGTLEVWHLSEDLTALPELDNGFLYSNASDGIKRCSKIANSEQFLLDMHFDYYSTRAMKPYSIPGMGLRF